MAEKKIRKQFNTYCARANGIADNSSKMPEPLGSGDRDLETGSVRIKPQERQNLLDG